jgi:hypothetical protein
MHAAGDDEKWLIERGIDGRAVATALWSERSDPGRMIRVIIRSLSARKIYVG